MLSFDVKNKDRINEGLRDSDGEVLILDEGSSPLKMTPVFDGDGVVVNWLIFWGIGVSNFKGVSVVEFGTSLYGLETPLS